MHRVPQVEHLDETPIPNFLFRNILAQTRKSIKATVTTISRGTESFDGYVWTRSNECSYAVESPKGGVYRIAYDPELQVASCTCLGCVYNGICKHLIYLSLNKPAIDDTIDRAERQARLNADIASAAARLATRKPEPVKSARDGWDAFFDEIDRQRAAEYAEDLREPFVEF